MMLKDNKPLRELTVRLGPPGDSALTFLQKKAVEGIPKEKMGAPTARKIVEQALVFGAMMVADGRFTIEEFAAAEFGEKV